ncbi:hypothetical protein [Nocardia vaccinii]|uniref:hypothetical protein n=1 Tax=Nocardia vaccinii TaxID=1822 RepID=UPI0012F4BB9C|nr:hypothetical protein [Nocardia vaccinii]
MVFSLLILGACWVVDRGSAPGGFDTTLIGADFADRNCKDGQVLRATEDNPKFLLRIIGSTRCRTAWADIEWLGPFDQQPDQIEASIYPMGYDRAGPQAQVVRKSDTRYTRTGMIERGSRGSVCAVGGVVVDGHRSTSQDELCD